jgi:hypothetical protein
MSTEEQGIPVSRLLSPSQQGIPQLKPIRIGRILKCLPFPALCSCGIQLADAPRNLSLPLNELQAKARCNVKRNMAMGKPNSGVIRGKCKHQIATGGQRGGVATRGVVELETGKLASPRRIFLGVEDVEVVAMEMDWMG